MGIIGIKSCKGFAFLNTDELGEFLHRGMVFDERFEVIRMNPDIDKRIRKKVVKIFSPSGSLSPSVSVVLKEKLQEMGMGGIGKIDRRNDLPLLRL